MFGGVELAYAGLGDVAIPPPPAVETPPLPDVEQTVGDAVADAQAAVEDVVADAPATVESAAETAKDAVAGTPVEPVLSDVEKTVEPIVKGTQKTIDPVVGTVVEQAKALPALKDGPAATAGGKAVVSTAAQGADVPGAALASPNGRSSAPSSPLSLPVTGGGSTDQLVSTGSSVDASSTSAPGDLSRPWLSDGIASSAALQAAAGEREGSSNAPFSPFAPLFPAETPTASATGATGAALVGALLAAFLLLAPRSGRLARPGPNLARPDPCLSLPGRPG